MQREADSKWVTLAGPGLLVIVSLAGRSGKSLNKVLKCVISWSDGPSFPGGGWGARLLAGAAASRSGNLDKT